MAKQEGYENAAESVRASECEQRGRDEMKKFLNDPASYVDDMLEGLIVVHSDTLRRLGESGRVIALRARSETAKVGLVSGGGSGHLPLFTGYVGRGLLDACAIGDVFSSPNVNQILDAIKSANHGAGVLALYGNYSGDKMNFGMALELAQNEGINVRFLVMTDDVASASTDEQDKRRGVAGLVYLYKIVGAATEAGVDLAAAAQIGMQVIDSTRTLGVALTPCTVPTVGHPTFSISDSEMEIGMGIHGEPGVKTSKVLRADAIAEEILAELSAELALKEHDRVSVLVNSLGATPLEELYIVYRSLHSELTANGITVVHPLIGRFATSMEMAGLSVTLLQVDSVLERYLGSPCDSPFWRVQ